jgi:hypothetical protein
MARSKYHIQLEKLSIIVTCILLSFCSFYARQASANALVDELMAWATSRGIDTSKVNLKKGEGERGYYMIAKQVR